MPPKKQLRPCHIRDSLIAQAKQDDLKECTFTPSILKTKVAQELGE